jgi:hypothetical protein
MGIKGHNHGGPPGFPSAIQSSPDHGLMANMKPIEDADRQVG